PSTLKSAIQTSPSGRVVNHCPVGNPSSASPPQPPVTKTTIAMKRHRPTYRGKAEIQHSGLFTERTAGKYSASDDTLTIEADYHCAAFEHTQRSRYSWMLRNRRLVLRVQHDPCRERRKCLDGVVYRSRHAHST